jgi:hypothetical protein
MEGLMAYARKVTEKDYLIWRLLQDPLWRVTADGRVETRVHGRRVGEWRRAGWVSPSRNGTKLYRRVQYQGEELYEHRIVFAAAYGHLSAYKTVNHKKHVGLENHPHNLELVTPAENLRHAKQFYRRSGMSAAEARANWIKAARGQHGTDPQRKTGTF